jgi:hypothetical protein
MERVLPVVAMAILPVTAGCSSGPPQDLLGPPEKVGDAYHMEAKITMLKGNITVTDGGTTEKGHIDMTMESVEDEEVLAVGDLGRTKSRVTIRSDNTNETFHVEGHSDSHAERSPLEGESIEFEKVGDEWKKTLVGKTPNAKQVDELKWYPPPLDASEFYPIEPVKPGHRWNVDVKKLFWPLITNSFEIESGSWSRKFDKTIMVDGDLFTLISEELELKGRGLDGKGRLETVEFKLSGTSQRSLERGITVVTQLYGTLTSHRNFSEGGRQLQMMVSGLVTIELTAQQK